MQTTIKRTDLEGILARLEGVRKAGDGYNAKCPSHADKSPSLSIKELDDGRVLMHCFAGCTVHEIMHSIGISFKDLFPEGQKKYESYKSQFTPKQMLDILHYEVVVINFLMEKMHKGEPFNQPDRQAFQKAKELIYDIKNLLEKK